MLYFLKFGETFLKSKTTRKRFVQLFQNQLKGKWFSRIENRNAYLLVHWEWKENELNILLNTFWIQKIEVIRFVEDIENNLDSLYKLIDRIIPLYDFNTFRISCKRENKKFPMNSMDIQMELWKYVCDNFDKQASYKNFDLNINIRILNDKVWIWTNQDSYNGIWWLPYWIEWKALNLFSGGIDSPVATYLAAKRWIKQDFLFLNIPWSDLLLSQVFEIYSFLWEKYSIKWKFFSLDLSKYIKQIKENIENGYRQIIFKIFLYKISDKFAKKLKVNSIINGENLWQVSTQTMTNMELLDKINNQLNIRPLICYDKIEIIEIANKIWTFNLSTKIQETCSLEEHSDSKIKNIKKILWLYNSLNFDLDEILWEIININKTENLNILQYKVNTPKGEIIDIENISKIPTLNEEKEYTFTCSSWYKASQKVLETRKEWFKTYFM